MEVVYLRAKVAKYKISLQQFMVPQTKKLLKKKDRTLSAEHRYQPKGVLSCQSQNNLSDKINHDDVVLNHRIKSIFVNPYSYK